MKLLLTSSGLADDGSRRALAELAGRPLTELRAAVVPTASNVIAGDKRWLVGDYVNLYEAGLASVDVVDVSALEPEQWRPRLEEADVLVVTGGDTTHLLRWLRRSGLADVLADLLATRVYVGLSAGSMVTGPHLRLSRSARPEPDDTRGLGLVDLLVLPHLGAPHVAGVQEADAYAVTEGLEHPTYALADGCSVVVDGDDVRVVGEGRHLLIAAAVQPQDTPSGLA